MFLININDILYVRTKHYDILSTSCIDKISICNIDKDSFVYTWYRQIIYIGYSQKYLCLHCIHIYFPYII